MYVYLYVHIYIYRGTPPLIHSLHMTMLCGQASGHRMATHKRLYVGFKVVYYALLLSNILYDYMLARLVLSIHCFRQGLQIASHSNSQ